MADQGDCGCCAGVTAETPVATYNSAGLPALAYRIGTQPTFKASLLARLSSTDYPALAALTARSDDDWTIALCDAFACAVDVLTFYQERIVNESFLRTATELRSVIELARLIGYKPAPGVAASTTLAFALEPAPGQPALAAQPVTIPAGTRVQSIPDPNQTAQTFETLRDVPARVEWNAMPAQIAQLPPLAAGVTNLYVAGTGLQIQAGDAIALVGSDRYATTKNTGLQDVRWLDRVEEDSVRGITRLSWSDALSTDWNSAPAAGSHVYVFRQRATLFGAAAPDANLVYNEENNAVFDNEPPNAQWKDFKVPEGGPVDLDALYPKAVNQSWFVLRHEYEITLDTAVRPVAAAGNATGATIGEMPIRAFPMWRSQLGLYRISTATQLSRSGFALSAKITRLTPEDPTDVKKYPLRDTIVLLQSEELTPVARPLRYPVFGSAVTLGVSEPDIAPGQSLAISGKLQRVSLPRDTTGITFIQPGTRQPVPGESFRMSSPPELQISASAWQPLAPEELPGARTDAKWRWTLLDDDGTTVQMQAPPGALRLTAPLKSDKTVSEVVILNDDASAVTSTPGLTALRLKTPLAHCYDRMSFAVNANVADATHGETVNEIAGSGNAGLANQSFQLRQSPLTYLSSATAAQGAQPTLKVRANNLLWQEASTLYAQRPTEHVYELGQDDRGITTMQFGDGIEGARLPTGQNNIRLVYRKGLGVAGNLRAGQLTSLLTRPLGVKSVVNANDATGGQDAESIESARLNAPLPILTMDRVVSVDDYVNYARAFAGIAKAHALWIDNGIARGVYLTVAGAGGSAIPNGSDTQTNLINSLRNHGDPLIPLTVQTYANATFTLKIALKWTADADPRIVSAAVVTALRSAYSFNARNFGEAVTIDDVYAVIQSVEGVLAADIQQLYRTDEGPLPPQPRAQLAAALPAIQGDGSVNAAELLTLDAASIEIGAMR